MSAERRGSIDSIDGGVRLDEGVRLPVPGDVRIPADNDLGIPQSQPRTASRHMIDFVKKFMEDTRPSRESKSKQQLQAEITARKERRNSLMNPDIAAENDKLQELLARAKAYKAEKESKDHLKRQLKEAQDQTSAAETQMQSVQAEADASKATLEEVKKELELLKKNVEGKVILTKPQFEELKAKITNSLTEIQDLHGELRDSESDVGSLIKQLRAMKVTPDLGPSS